MASPLEILGDIGGGLSTIGAQGAGGAYEGVLEGEALKRRFSASDADTNLRILQGTLMQQQLAPQFHTDPQGRTFLIRPGQPPQFWGFAPQRPPTDLEKAHTDYYRAAAEGKLLGPPDKADKAPTKSSVEGQILSEYVNKLMTQGPQAAQQWLKDAYTPIRQAEAAPGAHQPFLGSSERPSMGRVVLMGPDGKPHVYQTRTVTDKDGNTETKKIDMGVAPMPGGGMSGAPRVTVTETQEETEAKPIWRPDELGAITKSLPNVLTKVLPSFTPPMGPTARLSTGEEVDSARYLALAENAIKKEFRDNMGMDVVLQWQPGSRGLMGFGATPGQFVVVRARELAKKGPKKTTKTTGPPSIVFPQGQPAEESDQGGK